MTSAVDAGCLMVLRLLPELRLCVVLAEGGQCLMLVAAGMVRLLFTGQLKEAICRLWSFLWLGARTCMLKPSECC